MGLLALRSRVVVEPNNRLQSEAAVENGRPPGIVVIATTLSLD